MTPLAAFVLVGTGLHSGGIGTGGAQESVDLRFNPPLDQVTEFVTAVDAELADGTPIFDARIVIAQRAKREGTNFRFNRYVSSSIVETSLPKNEMAGVAEELRRLNGKSFPILVSPDGRELPSKRGKYDNDASDIPNFLLPAFGRIAVGEEHRITGFSLGPDGQATLREVRDLGSDRAAVFAFVGDPAQTTGSGTLVLSVADGILLFFDIRGELKSPEVVSVARVHLRVKRQNVVGLDRLLADLRLSD